MYVNGDPVNLVDPNGHKACHGSDGCGSGVTNNVDNQPTIVTSAPAPHNGGYSYKDPGFGGAKSQGYDFSVPQVSGGGSVQISLFIAARESCVVFSLGPCLAGDNRTFDPRAPTGRNRASLVIDYDKGEATLVVNPSCDPSHTECHDAFPVTFGSDKGGSSENDLTIGTARFGKETVVVIGTDFHESVFTPPLVGDPGIRDTIALAVSPAGEVHGYVVGLGYPSVEIYHRSSSAPGQVQTLYQAPEGGFGPTRLYGYAPRLGAF